MIVHRKRKVAQERSGRMTKGDSARKKKRRNGGKERITRVVLSGSRSSATTFGRWSVHEIPRSVGPLSDPPRGDEFCDREGTKKPKEHSRREWRQTPHRISQDGIRRLESNRQMCYVFSTFVLYEITD